MNAASAARAPDLVAGPVPDLAAELRRVARRFATGVTVVAVRAGDGTHGFTANSFVTLSLDPVLVGFTLRRDGRFGRLVGAAGRFGVSILAAGQSGYARHYADRGRGAAGPDVELESTGPPWGVPVVPGCLGVIECTLYETLAVGDHDLVVGEVRSCRIRDAAAEPLVFLDGDLTSISEREQPAPL